MIQSWKVPKGKRITYLHQRNAIQCKNYISILAMDYYVIKLKYSMYIFWVKPSFGFFLNRKSKIIMCKKKPEEEGIFFLRTLLNLGLPVVWVASAHFTL